MNAHIQIIQHKNHRYPTVGDWWWDAHGTLQIRVSEMSDGRYEQLVAIHEYIEAVLCDEAGVDETEVTAFDVQFENNRPAGNTDEPGDCINAPYYKQHQTATAIERLLAVTLGVDWNKYEQEINSL